MTVSSTVNRKTFAGNGVTTSFATSPVVFFDTSDLVLTAVTDSTGASEALVENTDYTVTGGAGSTGTVSLAGGSSPYGAPAAGITLVIRRVLPLTQDDDFLNNDINDAEVLEDRLDRLTMIAQQLDEGNDLGVRLSSNETATDALTVLPFDRASRYLGFDASKELVALAAPTSTALTTAYSETLLAAANAAAARTVLGVPSSTEAILDAIVDAKGDLIVGTAADTVARKAAGSDYSVLSAESAQSDGLVWASGSQGIQSFRRLVAAPASSTEFRVKAQSVVTIHPTTGRMRKLGAFDVTSLDLAAAQGASAARGRDQSATFSAGVIYCYVISGSGQTDSILFSTSETAPTLPTGYTEWALVGPIRWGGASMDANYRYRGSVCTIDGGVNVLSGGSATAETSISMTGYVSANTEVYRISGSGTITADASANHDVRLDIRSITSVNQVVWGSPYKAASAGAASMPTWLGKECQLANPAEAASIYYMHTVTVGSAPSTTLTLRGFVYPNGAN